MKSTFCLSIFIVVLTAFSKPSNAQQIFITQWKSDADAIVFESKWKSDADLIVYVSEWKSDADKKNEGIWYYTKWKSDGKQIFITPWKSDADIIVYYTKWKSEAGWVKKDKKHLLEK